MSNNTADMWMTDHLGSDITASVTLDLGSAKTINRIMIYNWNGAEAHRGMRWIRLLGDGNEPLISGPIELQELTGVAARLTSAHADAFDDRALLTNQFSPVLACEKCSTTSLNTSTVSTFGPKTTIAECACNAGLLRRHEECLGPLMLTPVFNISNGSVLNLATDNLLVSATLENIDTEDMEGIEDCVQINYWTDHQEATMGVLARYCRDQDNGDWVHVPVASVKLPQLETLSIFAFTSQPGRLNSTTVATASYHVYGNLESSVLHVLNGSGVDCLPEGQFRFYMHASVGLACTQTPESTATAQIWAQLANSSSNESSEFVQIESDIVFELPSSVAQDGSLVQPTNFSIRAYCTLSYYFDSPEISYSLRVLPPLNPPTVHLEPLLEPADFLTTSADIVIVGSVFTSSYSDLFWYSFVESNSSATSATSTNWVSSPSDSNVTLSMVCLDDFQDHHWILLVKSDTEGFESSTEQSNYTLYCAPNPPSITPDSGTYWESLSVTIETDNDDQRIDTVFSLDNGNSWNEASHWITMNFTDVGNIGVLAKNIKTISDTITLESTVTSHVFSLKACSTPIFYAIGAATRTSINSSSGGDGVFVTFDKDEDILLFINNTVLDLAETPIYFSVNGGVSEQYNKSGIVLRADFDEISYSVIAQQHFPECNINYTIQITYIIEPQPPPAPEFNTLAGIHWEQVEIAIRSGSADPRVIIEYSLDEAPFELFNSSNPPPVVTEPREYMLVSRSCKNVTVSGVAGTLLFSTNVTLELAVFTCSPPIFMVATFNTTTKNITSSWITNSEDNDTQVRFTRDLSDHWDSIIILIQNTVPLLSDTPVYFSISKAMYDISNMSVIVPFMAYDAQNPPVLEAPDQSFQSLPLFYSITAQQNFTECEKNFTSNVVYELQTKVPPAPPDITIPDFSNMTNDAGDIQIVLVENEDIQFSTNNTDVVVSWQIVDVASENMSDAWIVVNSSTGANAVLLLTCVNYTDRSVSLRIKAMKNSVESPVYTYNLTMFCSPPPPAIYPASGSFPADGEPLLIEMNNTHSGDPRIVVYWSLVNSKHRDVDADSSFSFDSPLVLTEPGLYTVYGHSLKNVTYRDPLINTEGDIIRQYSVLPRCEPAIAVPASGEYPSTQDLFVNLTCTQCCQEGRGLDIFYALDDNSTFLLLSRQDSPLKLHFGTDEVQFETVTRRIRFFTVDSRNGSCFESMEQQANYTILPIAPAPVVFTPVVSDGSAGFAHNITLKFGCPSNDAAVPSVTLKDLNTNEETTVIGTTSEIEVTVTNTTAVSVKCSQNGRYSTSEWKETYTIMPRSRPKPPTTAPLTPVHTLDATNNYTLQLTLDCVPQPDCRMYYTLDGSPPMLEIDNSSPETSKSPKVVGTSTFLYDPLIRINITDVGPLTVNGIIFHPSFDDPSSTNSANYMLFARFKPLQWSSEPGTWLNSSLNLIVPSSGEGGTVECAVLTHEQHQSDGVHNLSVSNASLLIQRLVFSNCQGGAHFSLNSTSTIFVRRSSMHFLPLLPSPFIENATFCVNTSTHNPDNNNNNNNTSPTNSTDPLGPPVTGPGLVSVIIGAVAAVATSTPIVGTAVVAGTGVLIFVVAKKMWLAHSVAAKAHTAKLFTVSGLNVPQSYQSLQ